MFFGVLIIDLEDAAGPDKCSSGAPRSKDTLPGCMSTVMEVISMFREEIGLLIGDVREFAFNITGELLELGRWMQEAEPSSQDALDAIEAYKNSFGYVIDNKLLKPFLEKDMCNRKLRVSCRRGAASGSPSAGPRPCAPPSASSRRTWIPTRLRLRTTRSRRRSNDDKGNCRTGRQDTTVTRVRRSGCQYENVHGYKTFYDHELHENICSYGKALYRSEFPIPADTCFVTACTQLRRRSLDSSTESICNQDVVFLSGSTTVRCQ